MRLLADENLDERLLRALMRRDTSLDITRVRDEGMCGASDPALLAWAAEAGRIVLTHDVQTMPGHAHARIAEAHPCPGVLIAPKQARTADIVEDILLLHALTGPEDLRDRILYLPLR